MLLAGHGAGIESGVYYAGCTAAAGHLAWQVRTADPEVEGNLIGRFKSNDLVGWGVLASILSAHPILQTVAS